MFDTTKTGALLTLSLQPEVRVSQTITTPFGREPLEVTLSQTIPVRNDDKPDGALVLTKFREQSWNQSVSRASPAPPLGLDLVPSHKPVTNQSHTQSQTSHKPSHKPL